jgi:hypothetical protein
MGVRAHENTGKMGSPNAKQCVWEGTPNAEFCVGDPEPIPVPLATGDAGEPVVSVG